MISAKKLFLVKVSFDPLTFQLVRFTLLVNAMRRILCVAEKNDVAKGVANILGRGNINRREGKSKFNKIYQFQADVFGQVCFYYTITSLLGVSNINDKCIRSFNEF